ncbi:MAG TPA: hypothetical protein PLP25_02860, partial [Candidatus Limiplasma sp.]|nr:hypothetical protein [Candidatus Limiplasma sp.]
KRPPAVKPGIQQEAFDIINYTEARGYCKRVYNRAKSEALKTFIITENIHRIGRGLFGHKKPWNARMWFESARMRYTVSVTAALCGW